ncbi:hypothetical protein H6G76_31005 [Nostoc sp. FACHB-152]|uniref:hypothetical protein n=1 Tax=unclassified Nostoc TaxID=2593658 RepID=UPI0016826629|nr:MULTISPECIES: hypothetical protein [unclassified Nostoc]MBD2451475.1 hypothetical protein [Nostoc sp. FACHB-152]MBD2472516.1 hypothetical protein [Nostoc sp. FACHB-145]
MSHKLITKESKYAMSGNPFISARVPSEVLEQLESYAEATGESKSKILLKALVSYLENPTETSITTTEKRIRTLENYVHERFKSLEAEVDKLDKKIFYLQSGH